MAVLEIHPLPPNKLSEKGVSERFFQNWRDRLEEFLSKDKNLRAFMTSGAYCNWKAYEVCPDRITDPAGSDGMEHLPARRAELCNFLKIVAKACDIKHYDAIIAHSTSLQWIYSRLCEDYNIQQQRTNFFNLFDLQYQQGTNIMDFYNQYRNLVIANLKKQGDIIMWQNSRVLETDEELSPTFEDMILANVLSLIDCRLLGCVRENYQHLMGRKESLMDYKTDIMVQVPTFLIKIEDDVPDMFGGDDDQNTRYGYCTCWSYSLFYCILW